MKNVAFVVGTRPEVIKLAPIIEATTKQVGLVPCVISTGQQGELLKRTLLEFDIKPTFVTEFNQRELNLTEQFGNFVKQIGVCIQKSGSQYIVTQGDTSSAFAGALAGFLLNTPVGHVEAGLRSHNLKSPFPEEGYRIMISRIATDHFAPTAAAVKNLLSEGIPNSAIHLVGNPVVDSVLKYSSPISTTSNSNLKQILVTLHRRESFGQPIRDIANAIRDLCFEEKECQVNVIVHPNPNSGLVLKEVLGDLTNVNLMEPLTYRELLQEIRASHFVLTDSGGIQEECAVIGTTLLIARNETERPEVLSANRRLIGTNRSQVFSTLKAEMKRDFKVPRGLNFDTTILGDGHSGSRICKIIGDSK